MDLKRFKEEKIAIQFDTEAEMMEFLKECEKADINWRYRKATEIFPFNKCSKTCLTYGFSSESLGYADTVFYASEGYKVIPYKEFKSNCKTSGFEEIKRIAINKKTTIVFWSDGTKTLVKRGTGQENNPELAILYAYFQKHSGLSKTKANKAIQELVNNIQLQGEKK